MVGYTIIGAGLSGLSLAMELLKFGINTEVIEYRDYAGGIHALIPEVRGIINDALGKVNVQLTTTAIRSGNTVYMAWRGGLKGTK